MTFLTEKKISYLYNCTFNNFIFSIYKYKQKNHRS